MRVIARRLVRRLFITVAAVLVCAIPTVVGAAERPFLMGFTPFPYDSTDEAIDWTWTRILRHGDLVVHHLDTGVPWQEALDGTPYPALVEGELQRRIERTPESHRVYLAVTPIATLRDGLAQAWTNAGPTPLAEPWARRRLRSPKVVRAFTNYCLDLIERFEPDYFAYAIEVDILRHNNPQAFRDFRVLARRVYNAVRAEHPELPIFFTFSLGLPAEWEDLKTAMAPLWRRTDMLAISTYPYLVPEYDGKPAAMQEDYFSRIREIDPDKPIAVAETGYTAQPVHLETFDIHIPGSPSYQRNYIRAMLDDLTTLDAEFVAWFTVVDYDALWEQMEAAGVSELFKVWRDIGLYSGNLARRPGFHAWNRFFKRALSEDTP